MTLTISTAEFCSADEKFLPFQRYDTAFPVLLSLVLFKEEILFLASPFLLFPRFRFPKPGTATRSPIQSQVKSGVGNFIRCCYTIHEYHFDVSQGKVFIFVIICFNPENGRVSPPVRIKENLWNIN